jgi:CheY-like chemotaxis protein
MVTSVLEKRGYIVVTATDGEDGINKAIAHVPDLVICDVMMPRKDGWTLVKTLRSRPEFAFVPVIFLSALGSDEDRIRGFRLGADDYMPKPFRFEELDLRVANAIRRRQAMEASTRAQVKNAAAKPEPAQAQSGGLRGGLDQIGLAPLLSLLEMEKKSGLLVVTRGTQSGRVFMRQGRVVKAEISGNEAAKNASAVFELLGWAAGTFEFTAFDVDMTDEVQSSTTHLLIEGARRLDEGKRDN